MTRYFADHGPPGPLATPMAVISGAHLHLPAPWSNG